MPETQCPHGSFVLRHSVRCELPWEHVTNGTAHQVTIDGEVYTWYDMDWEEL